MIKKENIRLYLDFETNIPKKSGLLSLLLIMMIVCVPASFFGVYSTVTKIVMLPLVMIMSIWIICLLVKTDTERLYYNLFQGIFSLFMSVSFLVLAYKIVAARINISETYIVLILILYVIMNLLNIFNTLRLIRKGYFNVKRKTKNPTGLIFAASLFGLVTGRVLIGGIRKETAAIILIIGLIFFGFLFSIGSNNLLKYYFARKYNVTK